MTTVVNIKSGDPWDVYIGRASFRARDPRCHVGSEWANPFRVRAVGRVYSRARVNEQFLCGSIGEVLEKYERRLRDQIRDDPGARARLLALDGKRLGCWCHPDPCHGHVIIKVIEELRRGGGA